MLYTPAPQHTLVHEPTTPPANFEREKEETPGFEGPTTIPDNSQIKQGDVQLCSTVVWPPSMLL